MDDPQIAALPLTRRTEWPTIARAPISHSNWLPLGRAALVAGVLLYLGAVLVLPGLCHIDDAFNVFSIPFFLESYDELAYVLERLTPLLKERLEAKGFVLLAWGHAGWVRVFSTKPVRTLEELQAIRMYTSTGSEQAPARR